MIEENRIKVWDIGIRNFHWLLVILFFITYVSGEEESRLHIYAAYGVIGLVAFRIVWGFVGTKHTRFSDFIYGPKSTFKYVRSLITSKPKHYLGHNPVGGWMIFLLLISLISVSWSGLYLYGTEGHGPLASKQNFILTIALANDDEREHDNEHEENEYEVKEDDEAGKFWKEVHEVLANLTLLLVFVHIAGVLLASAIHQENLIKAMITGYKYIKKP